MHMCAARVAGWVGEEEQHTYCHYAYRLYFLTCDMYKSSLKHLHDPVLLSLKMKGILSFLYYGVGIHVKVRTCTLCVTFLRCPSTKTREFLGFRGGDF
jgi:hypothetical protein